MATPNYSYEKRQRELAKKRKAEEKRMRKLNGKTDSPEEEAGGEEGSTSDAPEASTDASSPPNLG